MCAFAELESYRSDVWVLYAGVVGFAGSLLYFYGQRELAVSRAMPLTYLELLVAIGVGQVFFGEQLSGRALVGGAIVASAYLSSRVGVGKRAVA